MHDEKKAILAALDVWLRQRSGRDFRNYGDRQSYMAEVRECTRELHDAQEMLRMVRWTESITAEHIKDGFRAFSGRLSWDGNNLSYCMGQYFPTEYRAAVCAVAASILWSYFRECANPATDGVETYQPGIVNVGEYIRKRASRELGRGIASRWFR